MARTRAERYYKNWKVVIFWVLGAVCITIASMIASNLETGLGVTRESFLFALGLSFLLYLVGGLLWISVAVAIKELEET